MKPQNRSGSMYLHSTNNDIRERKKHKKTTKIIKNTFIKVMSIANLQIKMWENGQTGNTESLFWQSVLLVTLKH